MENTAIRTPSTHSVARNTGARPAAANEAADATGGFSLLLADMTEVTDAAETTGITDITGMAGLTGMADMADIAEPALAATGTTLEDPLARVALPAAEWPSEVGAFSLASLVGQTARMDGAADAALRDSRAVGDAGGDGVSAAASQAALPMGGGRGAASTNLPAAATTHAWGRAHAAGGTAQADAAADLSATTAVAEPPSTLSLNPAERGAVPHGLAALLARLAPEPEATPWAGTPAPGLGANAASAATSTGTADAAAASVGGGTAVDAVFDNGSLDTASADAAAADAVLAQPDDAWADQLSEQVAFWVQQKTQRAEMTIDRQGRPVQVQLTINGNEAHVTFRSNEQQTREMLDAGTAQLREMLEQQGLNLASVSVQAGDAGGQGGSARQHSSGRPAGSPGEEGPRQTAVVSADLRARPDAARSVDLFV